MSFNCFTNLLITNGFFNILDVPNSGLRLISMPKRMKWDDEFQKYLKLLDSKKPVILAGDLNVAHEEIGTYDFIF